MSSEKIREERDEDTDSTSADAWNRALYKHVASHKYLRIFVSHEVLLRRQVPDSQRKAPYAQFGTPKIFNRWLKMVIPASVFLLAWSGMSPDMEAHGMLRFHPHSMRVV